MAIEAISHQKGHTVWHNTAKNKENGSDPVNISAKKPASWWEKHRNVKLNPSAQQTEFYSDTGFDCVFEIKVFEKGDISNTEPPNKCSFALPKDHKGVSQNVEGSYVFRKQQKTLGLQIELELWHPSSRKKPALKRALVCFKEKK